MRRVRLFFTTIRNNGPLGVLVAAEWQDLLGQRMGQRHLVAADVPVVLRERMLQVDVVIGEAARRIESGCDHRQATLVAVIQESETGLSLPGHGLQSVAYVLRVAHHVVADLLVAGQAVAQELVVLDVDAAGRSREVQRMGIGLAAEIGDRGCDVLAQIHPFTPDDPAGAAARLAVLVPAGRDGQDVRQAEVPRRQRLERRDEAAPTRHRRESRPADCVRG